MNILLLTHSYPNRSDALKGIFIREQAQLLSSFFDVTVVLFRVDYSHFKFFPEYSFSKVATGKLTEYEVTIHKSLPGITQIIYILTTYRFIVKEILNKNRPDLIHSHLSYPAGFLGTIIQKRKGIPNILTEHTKIRAYTRSWFHKQCLNYTYRNTCSIVSVSNTLKTEINQVFNRHISVIYNYVDVDKFKIPGTKDGDKINIGFIGRLGNYNKGLDLLLAAVSQLGRKDFLLHIGGSGSLIPHFKENAKELGIETNCKFYGEIPRDKIPEFYSCLDMFVLASRYETFGIVIIEAMASGIPVIATKCGGPQEIVTPSTGILVENENIGELTAAITYISENRSLYKAEVIRRYVKDNFGKQVFVKQISKLYNEIITINSNE
jgi:glycosyltransferase involved in cell wall biosynthesis